MKKRNGRMYSSKVQWFGRKELEAVVASEHENPWAAPIDETGVKLLTGSYRGEIPSVLTRVKVADLMPSDPPTVQRIRCLLRENPTIAMALVDLLRSGLRGFVTYRNAAGRLVMFDDYAAYTVAIDNAFESVDFQILGEDENGS